MRSITACCWRRTLPPHLLRPRRRRSRPSTGAGLGGIRFCIAASTGRMPISKRSTCFTAVRRLVARDPVLCDAGRKGGYAEAGRPYASFERQRPLHDPLRCCGDHPGPDDPMSVSGTRPHRDTFASAIRVGSGPAPFACAVVGAGGAATPLYRQSRCCADDWSRR